jgi:hypothetical protein
MSDCGTFTIAEQQFTIRPVEGFEYVYTIETGDGDAFYRGCLNGHKHRLDTLKKMVDFMQLNAHFLEFEKKSPLMSAITANGQCSVASLIYMVKGDKNKFVNPAHREEKCYFIADCVTTMCCVGKDLEEQFLPFFKEIVRNGSAPLLKQAESMQEIMAHINVAMITSPDVIAFLCESKQYEVVDIRVCGPHAASIGHSTYKTFTLHRVPDAFAKIKISVCSIGGYVREKDTRIDIFPVPGHPPSAYFVEYFYG